MCSLCYFRDEIVMMTVVWMWVRVTCLFALCMRTCGGTLPSSGFFSWRFLYSAKTQSGKNCIGQRFDSFYIYFYNPEYYLIDLFFLYSIVLVHLFRHYFFSFSFFFRTLLLSSFWTSRGHRCRPFSPPVLAFNFYRA